ncbi:dynamin family protein [Moraxella cuniculi]|uniref:GTPase Era n=1 Tax=Moraxella cuniculi TaxID=34061 RepID=A0A448GU61_9GAMM|nr:dynamin family protein [Moraxella cuniculi]VEG12302.1 GTPase Era [Moraxella cuniculi]
MKFYKQQILSDHWSQIMDIAERYEANQALQRYKPQVDNFIMRVPLVGVFSAGKSTLLNRLLGDKLLATDIDPRTSIATELHYGTEERFIGHLADGTTISLSRDDVSNENIDRITPHNTADKQGWLSAYLPSPVLEQFPHVCLVDLPGLDSNLVSHNQMIDHYVQRSLAYCIVVSIEDGELKASTQDFLQALRINAMPVILIITKSDRKPDDEVAAISAKITQSITNLLGREPLKVAAVSARKGINLDEIIEALALVESQAELRFDEVVANPIVSELQFLVQNLDKRINTENLTVAQLLHDKAELQESLSQFRANLNKEIRELESQSAKIANRISENVKSSLSSQLDTLAHHLVNGQDISRMVENNVRLTISQGIQSQLLPIINAHVGHIQDSIPNALNVQNPDISLNNQSQDNFSFGDLLSTLSPILALIKIHPVARIVSLLPTIVGLLDGLLSIGKKEQLKEQQLQLAREKILYEVIPNVQTQAQSSLNEIIGENIRAVKAQIELQIQERNDQIDAQLSRIQADIQLSQAEQEARRQGYQADQTVLQNLLANLTSTPNLKEQAQ